MKLRRINLFVILACGLLFGCATGSQKSGAEPHPVVSTDTVVSTDPEARAQIYFFFKSSPHGSIARDSGLFLNGARVTMVPPRQIAKLELSPGNITLQFGRSKDVEVILQKYDTRYYEYDQDIGGIFEHSEANFRQVVSLYPADEVPERPSVWKSLGQMLLAPLVIPGELVYSIVTFQPLQL